MFFRRRILTFADDSAVGFYRKASFVDAAEDADRVAFVLRHSLPEYANAALMKFRAPRLARRYHDLPCGWRKLCAFCAFHCAVLRLRWGGGAPVYSEERDESS